MLVIQGTTIGTDADMAHIEAGKLIGVGTDGQSVTLSTNYTGTLHAEGDYVAWAFGQHSSDANRQIWVGITDQGTSGFTVKPAGPNTIVRWFTMPRTQ